VTYPPAPTTFDELVKLIPHRGATKRYRFDVANRSFESQVGRNQADLVHLAFSSPHNRASFWPCTRTVGSLTSQRSEWSHWKKLLNDPDSYLTWKHIGRQLKTPGVYSDLKTIHG
jgi:hypothetical protein